MGFWLRLARAVLYDRSMLNDPANLPDDPARLRDLVASLASELKSRDILIEKLRHQLAGQRRHRFGASSETLDQLELGLEDVELARAAAKRHDFDLAD